MIKLLVILYFFERKILGSHVQVFLFFEKWWPIIDNEIRNICGPIRNIHRDPK